MRERLIRLAIACDGSFFTMRHALQEKHRIPEDIPLQPAITMLDDDYPRELFQLRYPPYVLFYRGDKELLRQRKIVVVGSRRATDYGARMTKLVVEGLKDRYVIVSGLAKGIDGQAHRWADKTIGVVANGLDVHYPQENAGLYEEMFRRQLVISEYPAGVKPLKEHFPFRNRIIAALGEAVIVTQAAVRSGTMLTVNEALNLNKDVYAVPYRADDPSGLGCNRLIQQGASVLELEELSRL